MQRHESSVAEILHELDQKAPLKTAEAWDNVGLIVGNSKWKTKGVAVGVDLTPELIKIAKKNNYKLIITHHSPVFPKSKGLSRLVPSDDLSAMVLDCYQSKIAVAAWHTCFDRCALEVSTKVADLLGLTAIGRLIDRGTEKLVKLVVFVPKGHAASLEKVLFTNGLGAIGRYDSCGFRTLGEGSFRAREGANPSIGQVGKIERVIEVRLELLIPVGLLDLALNLVKQTHPYEEVAYDIIPVSQAPLSVGLNRGIGYGLVGTYNRPLKFENFQKKLHQAFKQRAFLVTPASSYVRSPVRKQIRRVGFVAGKGSSFIGNALESGCDVLVTGEVGYHDAMGAARNGMSVVELGHRESERFFPGVVRAWLKRIGIEVVLDPGPTQGIAIQAESSTLKRTRLEKEA